MPVTYIELCDLVASGVIAGAKPEHINGASIDVTLGHVIWIEDARSAGVVDLAAKEAPSMHRIEMGADGYALDPGQFILAQTVEVFNLPNDISAEFRLKSSGARCGLDQALAVWCDPGWNGSVLTLELKNNLQHHRLRIRPGMKIGQMVLHWGAPVPVSASYATRGQYNGDREAQPSRGLR